MKTWKWLLILAIGLVAAFLLGMFLFGDVGYRLMSMHPRMGWHPRMGGFRMFGAGMMLFRMLLPLLIIGLTVITTVLVINAGKQPKIAAPAAPAAPAASCPNCGKPVQADWVSCPYCGEKL